MKYSSICKPGKHFYYINYPITVLHLKKFQYNLSFTIHLELLYNTVSGRMQACIFNCYHTYHRRSVLSFDSFQASSNIITALCKEKEP